MSIAPTVPENGGAFVLVVAWRVGRNVVARKVKIGGPVEEALSQYATDAAAVVEASEGRQYDPDEDQEELGYVFSSRAEAWDTALLEELWKGDALPNLEPEELGKTFVCYAALVGSGPSTALYIRKSNPISLATKSLVAGYIGGALTKVENRVFAFDSNFDVIVTADRLFALNKLRFELLFKDSAAVIAKAPEWVDEMASLLPMSPESKANLESNLKTSSLLRRKITSILSREYARALTVDTIRSKMELHGLEVERLMPDGELLFSPENTRELVRLLNQDLFRGDFSDEEFAAGSKQRRGND